MAEILNAKPFRFFPEGPFNSSVVVFEHLSSRMIEEWRDVSWMADDAKIHSPFCHITLHTNSSAQFEIGMRQTFTDSKQPGKAMCARVGIYPNEGPPFGSIVVIEDLGGAAMRSLYCELLHAMARQWTYSSELAAEAARYEALLMAEQAQAATSKAETTPPTLQPITDPTDQTIYKIIAAEDFDITDKDLVARLSDQGITLTREKVNIRRRAIRKMGYRVR